jgi:hypothetical protein
MANFFKNLFFKSLFSKNKSASPCPKKIYSRRLELEGMELRITPATVSVNGANQVVLTMVTGEKISSLHVDIVGSTITITDTTKSNNSTSGVIPAGVTVNNTNIVVDATTFLDFAGLVVNAAPGSTGCEVIVDAAGIDLSSAPGGTNQSVSIDLTASAKATLDIKSLIKTKGSGTIDFDVATIGVTAAGDITTGTGNVNISGATLIEAAGDITTSGGNIFFNDNLTLTGNIALNSGAGNILFGFTVDGDHNLTANSSGITTFSGIVGATKALKIITTNAGGTTVINTTGITTTGNQTYNDAVTLTANTTLNAGGGNIVFGSTLNGAFSLIANSSTITTFGNLVGNIDPLTSVTTNAGGTTNINTSAITTTGNQTYSDAITLGTDTTLTGTNPTFSAGVTGATHDLNLNFSGITTIGSNFTGIRNLTTNSGGTTSLSGTITTTGAQTYNDAVTLDANTILDAGVGNISFGSTLNGAFSLNAKSSGTTTFTGSVGGGTPLTSLTANSGGTTAINGGAITTTGTQTFNDAVTLSANTTLNSAADITFGSTLNGATFNMNINAGGLALTNNVSNIKTLSIENIVAAGAITLMGPGGLAIETQAEWNFLQPSVEAITLGSKTNTGTITVDAAWTNNSAITTEFLLGGAGKFNVDGDIGGVGSLTVIGSGNSTNINADITQTSINITDSVVVGGGVTRTLTATAASGVVIDSTGFVAGISASALATSLILTTTFATAPISLTGTLTNSGSNYLADLTMGGNGVISGTVALVASASIDGDLLLGNSSGINLNSNAGILSANSMNFGPVTTLTGSATLQTTKEITFNDTITDGINSYNLNLDAGALGAITGKSVAINNFTITNGASVDFTEAITVNDFITTANPYSVSMTGTGNTFAQNVDFFNTGLVTLGDTTGTDTFALNGGLSFTGNTACTVGGFINSTGDEINFGTGGVTLVATSTVNSTGGDSGADITFGDIVAVTSDNAQALTVNASINNTITFGADVGAPALRLSALNLTAKSVNYGGDVYVASNTNFGNVVLTANQTFKTSGTASFGTIDGATFDMTIIADDIALNGNISNIGTLSIENIAAAGTITLMGTGGLAIETQSEWNYLQPTVGTVVLGNTLTNVGAIDVAAAWINNSAVTVDFLLGGAGKFNVNGAVTGAGNLTVNGSGNSTTISADINQASINITDSVVVDGGMGSGVTRILTATAAGGVVIDSTGFAAGISANAAATSLALTTIFASAPISLTGTLTNTGGNYLADLQMGGNTVVAGTVTLSASGLIDNDLLLGNSSGIDLDSNTGTLSAKSMGFGVVTSLTGSTSLQTTTDISFSDSINGGANSLTLNASGTILATSLLTTNDLIITNSNGTTFTGTVGANNVVITDSNDGSTVAFQDNLAITTGMTVAAGGAYNVSITGFSNSIAGDTNFLNTGSVTIGQVIGTSSFIGGLDTTAAGSTNIAGTVETTNTAMDLGATTLADNGTLRSGSGPINVASITDGASSFALGMGNGTQTGTITITGNTTVDSLNTSAGAYSIALTGAANTITTYTTFLNTGSVTIGQAGGISSFVNGLNSNGGPFSANIAGIIQTTNSQMDLGDTTLVANATLRSGSGQIFAASITDGASSFAISLGDASQTGTITVTGNTTVDTLNTGAGAYSIELTGAANNITTNTNFLNTVSVTLGDSAGTDSFLFDGGLNFTGNAASKLGGAINSSGDVINFGSGPGGVTLTANSTIASTTTSPAGANIIFGSGITGAFDLGLDAGTGGAITGTSVAINNLTVTNSASGAFTGAVTVNDLITTANLYSVSMTGTGNTFVAEVDFLNTGNVALGNATDDTFLFNGGLKFAGNAATNIGATINSSADAINFGPGGVTLVANSLINSTVGGGGADITFGSTLNGNFSLGLTAGTGAITFIATVGNSADLASLTVSSAADISIGAALKATGLVSFSGNSGVDVFLGTAGAGLSLTDTELDFITTTGGLSIIASGAGVMVVNNVTGGGTITGTTTLSAGGTGVSFATTSSNFDNALTVASAAVIGVDISTSNDALAFNNAVKLNGNTALNTGAGSILFGNTLNGAFSLNAKSSSATTFSNIVGGVDALTSLTTNSGGTTLMNGGAITTTGNQTYNDAINLGANTALTSGIGNILFGSTITDGMSAFNLNLNAGAIGAITGTSVAINDLTINNGASAAFTGTVTVNDLITTTNPYSVSMTGTGNTFAQNVEFLNTGTVALNGTGSDSSTFTGGLVITAPSSVTIKGTLAATNSNILLGDSGTGIILASDTTLNAGTGNINLNGLVSGLFSLTPITSSPGLTTIAGANTNTTTNVTTGVVQINNTSASFTNYVVSGGALKGTGTIGALTGTGTGIIAPGNSPGQVTTTILSLSPTNTLDIELAGTNPGTQYDQIVVNPGTVTLGNAILTLSSTYAGSAGSVFTIVDNQGLGAVVGTFSGLPEGSVVSANGRAYRISYVGGTGNDVTLTAIPTVTISTKNLAIDATTITINGTGFDTTPANNAVTFNNGAIGTVNSATSTLLTITFSTQPTSTGSLTAVVTTNSVSSGATVQVATIVPAPTPLPLITGTPAPSSGGSSTVTLYDPATGQPSGTVVPFPGFSGELRVVTGDFNGDGKADIIAAAGPGGGPAVVVLDSETGAVMESFFAFDPAFTGGVFVAVSDFNGDGILDIIAGAGEGGGPEVRIFDGTNLNVVRAFFAYDESFTGGVSVAAIDFNGDGILDLVTGAGPGGAPHVKVFDGATNSIISQWFAYPISFTGGVYVAAGDIGNDGNIEIVTGAGMGGAPVVAVWDPYTGSLLAQFMAYAEEFSGGVRVGVSDGNSDGILDLITGAGPGGGPEVKGFSFPALDLLFSFYSGDSTNTGGVFVS